MLRAKVAKAKAKATAKAAVGETDQDRAGGQKTNKGLTDKVVPRLSASPSRSA